MKTLLLEEMTSPEIRQAIADGYKTVIVAAGSIEQHGKHLPIGTDTMAGTTCALEIAEGLGHTLVAPTIRPGCSDHHMPFAGTITIPAEVLKDLARAYCRSLAQHGFERIVLLATHGGNIDPLAEVAIELADELHCKIVSPLILGVPETESAMQPLLDKNGLTAEEGGIHAGFIETCEMLGSPYGHLVKMEHAERGFVGNAFEAIDKVKVDGHWKMTDLSPIGVLGDPRKATLEGGKELALISTPVYVKLVAQALGD
jgi:creatinine amidohydrolase